MKFTEKNIEEKYQKNLKRACSLLTGLEIAEGREPETNGLKGWIYEQTIRYCLSQELASLGKKPEISEQVKLKGRAKVDMLMGKVAIEIKANGLYSKNDSEKYQGYRKIVEENGWVYFYLTRSESYESYRDGAKMAFDKNRAFFLDRTGDWERFVKAVSESC
jgi:hypothetical protein